MRERRLSCLSCAGPVLVAPRAPQHIPLPLPPGQATGHPIRARRAPSLRHVETEQYSLFQRGGGVAVGWGAQGCVSALIMTLEQRKKVVFLCGGVTTHSRQSTLAGSRTTACGRWMWQILVLFMLHGIPAPVSKGAHRAVSEKSAVFHHR